MKILDHFSNSESRQEAITYVQGSDSVASISCFTFSSPDFLFLRHVFKEWEIEAELETKGCPATSH